MGKPIALSHMHVCEIKKYLCCILALADIKQNQCHSSLHSHIAPLLLALIHSCDHLIFRYFIRPRFIRDTSTVDMSTTLLGNKINFPICIAPTGVQGYLHWEGEIGTATGMQQLT